MGDDTSDDGASGGLDDNSIPDGGSDNSGSLVTGGDNPSNNLSINDLISALTGGGSADAGQDLDQPSASASNPLAALSSVPTMDWLIIGGVVLVLLLMTGRKR